MGEGRGGEEKVSFPSPLFLFRFHFSPFPQKRLILRLLLDVKLTCITKLSCPHIFSSRVRLLWGPRKLFFIAFHCYSTVTWSRCTILMQ